MRCLSAETRTRAILMKTVPMAVVVVMVLALVVEWKVLWLSGTAMLEWLAAVAAPALREDLEASQFQVMVIWPHQTDHL